MSWKRRSVERTGPQRGAGGFYRAAETAQGQPGGVPLNTPDNAVIAAVRLAYRVAEAQVERSTRLARRLRDAGDRAVGADSERKGFDAAERLAMNSMMSALEWWETSVAQGRCPVKRLAAAEYRMIGNILGFDVRGPKPAAPQERSTARKATREPAAGTTPREPAAAAPGWKLRIRHVGEPRPARVVEWEWAGGKAREELTFYSARGATFAATVSMERRAITIALEIPRRAAAGTWKAALCSADGEQLGFVELLL